MELFITAWLQNIEIELRTVTNLTSFFDEETAQLMDTLGKRKSFTSQYLLAPTLCTVAHLCGESIINPWLDWTEPSIIFASSIGSAGTNKSSAASAVKDGLYEYSTAVLGESAAYTVINECKFHFYCYKAVFSVK